MLKSIPQNADEDKEARTALWRAICAASDDVRHRFRIKSIYADGSPIRTGTAVPDFATWQLVEALCLLAIILRSEEAVADRINLLGKAGPIKIREDGIVRHLWAQQIIRGEKSALNGRPDLIVTSTPDQPNPSNAVRIIEAKCLRRLGTQTVRSEFGKAHDLRVATYLIWSFYSPSSKIIAGARGMGIDLEPLGFDTDQREDLVQSPEALIGRVAYAQEQAHRSQKFALALQEASQAARLKLVSPS